MWRRVWGWDHRPQVKHQGPSSGVGGDWAVRVHVARSSPLPRDVDASAPRPPKRISLVMYISDEDKPKVTLRCAAPAPRRLSNDASGGNQRTTRAFVCGATAGGGRRVHPRWARRW